MRVLQPDLATGCASLCRLVFASLDVTPAMHIPEHLSGAGTLVITWRHFHQQKFELDKSSEWSAVLLLNAYPCPSKTTAPV